MSISSVTALSSAAYTGLTRAAGQQNTAKAPDSDQDGFAGQIASLTQSGADNRHHGGVSASGGITTDAPASGTLTTGGSNILNALA